MERHLRRVRQNLLGLRFHLRHRLLVRAGTGRHDLHTSAVSHHISLRCCYSFAGCTCSSRTGWRRALLATLRVSANLRARQPRVMWRSFLAPAWPCAVFVFFFQTATFELGPLHDAFGWISVFNFSPQESSGPVCIAPLKSVPLPRAMSPVPRCLCSLCSHYRLVMAPAICRCACAVHTRRWRWASWCRCSSWPSCWRRCSATGRSPPAAARGGHVQPSSRRRRRPARVANVRVSVPSGTPAGGSIAFAFGCLVAVAQHVSGHWRRRA